MCVKYFILVFGNMFFCVTILYGYWVYQLENFVLLLDSTSM